MDLVRKEVNAIARSLIYYEREHYEYISKEEDEMLFKLIAMFTNKATQMATMEVIENDKKRRK